VDFLNKKNESMEVVIIREHCILIYKSISMLVSEEQDRLEVF